MPRLPTLLKPMDWDLEAKCFKWDRVRPAFGSHVGPFWASVLVTIQPLVRDLEGFLASALHVVAHLSGWVRHKDRSSAWAFVGPNVGKLV